MGETGWVRTSLGQILLQSWTYETRKLSAPKIQGWDMHRMETLIPKRMHEGA